MLEAARSVRGKTKLAMHRFHRYRVYLVILALVAVLLGMGSLWAYHTTRPEYRLRQGQQALLAGKIPEAERLAERLEAAGYSDHAHLLRGQIYLRQHRLNEAVEEYNGISHEHEDILAEASLIYGLGFLSLGHSARAEKLLRYVVRVRPNEVDAHRGLVAVYYDRGAMEQVLRHLKKWSDLDDKSGEPHRLMGQIFQDLDSQEFAIEQYRAALDRDLPPQTHDETVVELAKVLIRHTEFAEALAALDGCSSEASETEPAVAALRAECLYNLNRSSEAIRYLDPVLVGGTPSLRALRVRARIHADAGECQAAADLLERALRVDVHDTSCRYQLTLVLERLGRHAEAALQRRQMERDQRLLQQLSDLNREAIDKPSDVGIRRRLAEICTQLDKPELAQMWLRAAAACSPEAP
jgi:tetratricopeptide (TPR) repeat protein